MTVELEDLITDPRLKRLFSAPGRACALQIWIAQIRTNNSLVNRFVYGRLVPYSFSSRKWSASNTDKFESIGAVRAQLIQATLYIDSDDTMTLLHQLMQGRSINEISESLGLVLPDHLAQRIGNFALEPNSHYVYRPTALLLNRDAHGREGLQSQHGSGSAFSAAITSVNKENLFTTTQGFDADIARFLVKRMNADTGLSFAANDAARFGDLELLVFPTLDDDGRELLHTSWPKQGKILLIKLDLMQLSDFSKFFVHAKVANNGQPIFSSIASAHKEASDTIECRFSLPEGLRDIADSLEVEIHGMRDDDTTAVPCCHWKTSYIREIVMSGHLVGNASAEVRLGWLEKALKKRLLGSTRVKAAQTVNSDGAGYSSTVGGRQADPWVTANRGVSELLGVLHPPTSEARFFGRLSEGDGTERLQFVEWLKKQFAKYREHQVVFFDPYFDGAGIGLFVPNASDKGEYVIFTTKPSPKTPDQARESTKDATRIENILSGCKQLQALTHRIDLKIFGVKPNALHDRYMLITDRRGLPVAGFNFSNSLQHANEDHPLLITPIPMDALHRVFNYASQLLARVADSSRDGDESIEMIFDSKSQERPVRTWNRSLDFLDNELAGTVLATWTGNSSLAGLYNGALRTKLEQLKWLDGLSLRLPGHPGAHECFSSLRTYTDTSKARWEMMAEALARTSNSDLWRNTIQAPNRVLTAFLESSLDEAFLRPGNAASDDAFMSIEPKLFKQDIECFLRGSYSHERFYHHTKYDLLTWADFYAIKILWWAAPDIVVKLSERHAATLDPEEHHQDAIKLSLLSQIVSEVSLTIEFGISDTQRDSLLRSTNGFFKWLGMACLKEASKTAEEVQRVVLLLKRAERQERIRVLCWLLSGLGAKQENNASFVIVRQALYEALPSTLAKCEAEFLVDSLRGHMHELGWSEPWLFSGVMVPLLDESRVTPNELSDTWMKEVFAYLDAWLLGDSVSFSRSREGRVTEIAAFLFTRVSLDAQGKALVTLKKLLNKARANVQQPLSSTINRSKWDDSLGVAMWIYAFLRYVEHYADKSEKLPDEFVDLRQIAREVATVRPLDEWREKGVERGALVKFIEEIGEV